MTTSCSYRGTPQTCVFHCIITANVDAVLFQSLAETVKCSWEEGPAGNARGEGRSFQVTGSPCSTTWRSWPAELRYGTGL